MSNLVRGWIINPDAHPLGAYMSFLHACMARLYEIKMAARNAIIFPKILAAIKVLRK